MNAGTRGTLIGIMAALLALAVGFIIYLVLTNNEKPYPSRPTPPTPPAHNILDEKTPATHSRPSYNPPAKTSGKTEATVENHASGSSGKPNVGAQASQTPPPSLANDNTVNSAIQQLGGKTKPKPGKANASAITNALNGSNKPSKPQSEEGQAKPEKDPELDDTY
jgi:hypothetical protein